MSQTSTSGPVSSGKPRSRRFASKTQSDFSESVSVFTGFEHYREAELSIKSLNKNIEVIKNQYKTKQQLISDWDKDANDGSSILQTFQRFTSCAEPLEKLFKASPSDFLPLSHFLIDDELPKDFGLSEYNVNVINHIAKKFCMVYLEKFEEKSKEMSTTKSQGKPNKTNSQQRTEEEQDSEKNKDPVDSFWETMAFCFGLNNNSELFYSSLSNLTNNVIKRVEQFVNFLYLDETERNIVLLVHFFDKLNITLYVYSVLSARDCFKPGLEKSALQNILDIEAAKKPMPGTALLKKLQVQNTEHIEKEATQTPFIIVGNFNNRLYPFISHSDDPMEQDIEAFVTSKEFYRDGSFVTRIHIEGNYKMHSSFLLEPETKPEDLPWKFAKKKLFGRTVRIPAFKPLPFKQLGNATELGKKYGDAMKEFGAIIIRASDYSKIKPRIKKPNENETMQFSVQQVTKVEGAPGIYQVTNEDSTILCAENAKEKGHTEFQKMKPDDKLENFLVCSPTTDEEDKEKSKRLYLYAWGETCPFITDWSEYWNMLLSESTSTLQTMNKLNKIDGITSHHLYVSLGNSTFRAHVEDRGLNACNFLLFGVKFWVVLPRKQYPRFLLWLEATLGSRDFNECINWFQHKTTFFDPGFIPEEFQLTFIVQEAGDLVVLDNFAIHWGWNVEFNVAFSYNWTNNPSWDKVQHVLPVCSKVDESNCMAPALTTEELVLIRKMDNLVKNTTIPTNHLTDPDYNFYKSTWVNPYPTASPVKEPKETHAVSREPLVEPPTPNDSDDHNPTDSEKQVLSISEIKQESKSIKRKKRTRDETSSDSDSEDDSTDHSSSERETRKEKKKKRKNKSKKKKPKKMWEKITVKCKHCNVRRSTEDGLRTHMNTTKECRDLKKGDIGFVLKHYFEQEYQKEKSKKRKERKEEKEVVNREK